MAIKSMSLALADAIVVYLTAQQMVNPENFPSGLTWTAERLYMPILDEATIGTTNPANQPRVFVFPGNDSEMDIEGLTGQTTKARGEYEVGVLVEAFVGAPGPGFKAKIDPLMNLRQAIRTVLKPAGVVQPAGSVTGNVRLIEIIGLDGYDYFLLRNKQVFSTYQIFKFHVEPV